MSIHKIFRLFQSMQFVHSAPWHTSCKISEINDQEAQYENVQKYEISTKPNNSYACVRLILWIRVNQMKSTFRCVPS